MDDIKTLIKNPRDFKVDNLKIFDRYNESYNNKYDLQLFYNGADNVNSNLYFNFPWCENKCKFCNYTKGISTENQIHEKYIEYLIKHFSQFNEYFSKRKITSVYFGGGTPTILNSKLLDKYLLHIISKINVNPNTLITIETNPNNIVTDKMNIIRKYCNRLSIGVQTFNDNVRNNIGVISDGKKVLEKIKYAMSLFDNLNIDLIYGLEGQTLACFIEDIELCIEMKIPSISLYRLEFYDNFDYGNQLLKEKQNTYNLETSRFFMIAQDLFEEAGYVQCPTGWFVKVKDIAQNSWGKRVMDWENVPEYYGFGVGSYSHLHKYYLKMNDNPKQWMQLLDNNTIPIDNIRLKSNHELTAIKLLRILRSQKKISLTNIQEWIHSNEHIYIRILYLLDSFVEQGYMVKEKDIFTLTKSGLSIIHWLIDSILQVFIDFIDQKYN